LPQQFGCPDKRKGIANVQEFQHFVEKNAVAFSQEAVQKTGSVQRLGASIVNRATSSLAPELCLLRSAPGPPPPALRETWQSPEGRFARTIKDGEQPFKIGGLELDALEGRNRRCWQGRRVIRLGLTVSY
jgi:hypothetical protein